MPVQNRFHHQAYPSCSEADFDAELLQCSDSVQHADRLHTQHRVREVVIVHGTLMGDDPFAIAETFSKLGQSIPPLRPVLRPLAETVQKYSKPFTDRMTRDVGNYTTTFRDYFQQLVGDDPHVRLLLPTWSGQNHHFARADLAVRLLCYLHDLQPHEDERVLFWGHSHAGNGFALLSNLLANDPETVSAFFNSVQLANGDHTPEPPHWQRAREILETSESPHPLAQTVLMVAFGTPVRYGWDNDGYRSLLHVLHHRNADPDQPIMTRPLFPPHTPTDFLKARYGDWVQAFGIAGTDVVPTAALRRHTALERVVEAELQPPEHLADTRFIFPKKIRDACARWKTGTRCHADGRHLLIEYQPSGRRTRLLLPIEESLFGHGVATTTTWLPSHLNLILNWLDQQPT
jgi:hypothetical protein